jgi:hypothetical protein
MSDADYEAFLNKANSDPNEGKAQAQGQSEGYGTKSVNTAVPKELKSVEATYTSDADEPFEPVALSYQGGDITERKWTFPWLGGGRRCMSMLSRQDGSG